MVYLKKKSKRALLFYFLGINVTLHFFSILIITAPVGLKSSYFMSDTTVKLRNKVDSTALVSIIANF